jgi:hypothetical protein
MDTGCRQVSWVGDQLNLRDFSLLWTSDEICSKVGSFVSATDEQNQAGAEMSGQAGRQAGNDTAGGKALGHSQASSY